MHERGCADGLRAGRGCTANCCRRRLFPHGTQRADGAAGAVPMADFTSYAEAGMSRGTWQMHNMAVRSLPSAALDCPFLVACLARH